MGFDPKLVIQYVDMLIRHDEVERALWVLDNVPAHYRMNPPAELMQLKGEILANCVTPHHYTTSMGDDLDALDRAYKITSENVKQYLDQYIRVRLVRDEVQKMNAQGIVPHLIDFGPGQFLLPRALISAGYQFTYWDVGLNHNAKQQSRVHLKDVLDKDAARTKPVIFIANEVIEHLHNPIDLAVEAVGLCGRWPEVVMLSTPHCTYRVIPDDETWKASPLEHLRAYTPNEFLTEARQLFPVYVWAMHRHDHPQQEPMSLVGMRIDLVEKQTN